MLNVEANLQLQRNRDTLREIDAVRKRANYTPRQLLDPDELALERAKARGNYTPLERLAPDELALQMTTFHFYHKSTPS